MNEIALSACRLWQISSESYIARLTAEYCHGFDQRDIDRFLGVWWSDAVWDVGLGFGTLCGIDAIRQLVEDQMWPTWIDIRHWTTNLSIHFQDEGHASGQCSVISIGARSDQQAVLISATYTDRYEYREREWRIALRSVALHFMDPMVGTMLRPTPVG